MRVRKLLLLPVVTVLVLGMITYATTRAGAADAPPSVVSLLATDYSFEAPDRMPAGLVTVRLVNRGKEPHHAQLVRFRDGKTVEDMAAVIAAGKMPDFAVWEGGPGVVAPGMEASVTLSLRPGTYYWLCFVETPDEQHTPHLVKGMVRQVVVEEGGRERLPEADNTMMLNDYDFQLGRPLVAGAQTIRVRNYASQPHEVMVMKLLPGKTLDDVRTWVANRMSGELPAIPAGGMQALSNGLSANLEVDLEPGSYVLLCLVPDHADMQPHVAHGMIKEVQVE